MVGMIEKVAFEQTFEDEGVTHLTNLLITKSFSLHSTITLHLYNLPSQSFHLFHHLSIYSFNQPLHITNDIPSCVFCAEKKSQTRMFLASQSLH